jgi:predicted transcriptional regulator
MGRTRHEELRIQERRTHVAELYVKGWKQAAIARKLAVSQATISCDLKAIRKEWKQSRVRDFDEATMEEVRSLDVVTREAWEAWERSKEPAQTTRIIQKNGDTRAEKMVRERSGDPRFLQVALRASEGRCKLLGLDAAGNTTLERLEEEAIHAKASAIASNVFLSMIDGSAPQVEVIDDEYIQRLVKEQMDARPDIMGR